MKATIVLIADAEAENYGRRLMLEAHRLGGTGFEMARLPQHVSLKQPFSIASLEEMEAFLDEFSSQVTRQKIQMEALELYPSSAIGGTPSGCLSIRVKQSDELKALQKSLFSSLEARFGPCPADFDDDYVFHMTVAIGGAPYEDYQRAYDVLSRHEYKEELVFNRLGLLYYDDDMIRPGTYFCYKQVELM